MCVCVCVCVCIFTFISSNYLVCHETHSHLQPIFHLIITFM